MTKETLTSGSRENISLGNEVRISGNQRDTQWLMVSGESSFKDEGLTKPAESCDYDL